MPSVGIGRELDEHVEQLADAGAGARGHEAHRHQVAFAQRLLERRVQLLGLDLALLEVLRHQLLVDLDDLVDERAVRLFDRREIGFAGRIEKAVDDPLAAVGGQVDRQAFLAERAANRREHRRQIDVVGVDPVDDDEPAQLALGRPFHHARGDHLEPAAALMTTAAVSTASSAPIAWPMKSGKPGVSIRWIARVGRLEMQQRRAQRMLVRLFERIEVADRGAALDAAGRRDRAGPGEQRLGERRLARRTITYQRYSTNLFRRELRHGCLLGFDGANVPPKPSAVSRAGAPGRGRPGAVQ